MRSEVYSHDSMATLRVLRDGPATISEAALNAIATALENAKRHYRWSGHLFVTVVPGETIQYGSRSGFGCYQSGFRHVLVAGGGPPQEWDGTMSEWLDELSVTTLHEIAHYMQDIQGRLDTEAACEDEAEHVAQLILQQTTNRSRRSSFFSTLGRMFGK